MTDDRDRRCIMNILADYYCDDVLEEGHKYSVSGIYNQIPTNHDHNVSHYSQEVSYLNLELLWSSRICALYALHDTSVNKIKYILYELS